ncbi:MAG: flagellar biosynthesis protein FlhF [Gammaproteobacteria bacterium]
MKIKRFVANNMRQALQSVRKEQGPDAVILSNRRVEGGIEVVAAVDYDESLMAPATGTPRMETGGDENMFDNDVVSSSLFGDDVEVTTENEFDTFLDEGPVLSATDGASWSRESALGAIREEINGMRSLLSDQLSSMAWNDEVRRDPTTVNILRRYAAMGIDSDIARAVVDSEITPEDEGSCLELATRALASSLPILDDTVLDQGGVIAVIGPTGVGKTTSIAKLAARYALRHGRDQVALVSTDSFRIGAQEQLATFAQILDVPIHRVTDKSELGTLLASLSDKSLVLIDTAGVSQRVTGLSQHLSAFSDSGVNIKIYLALATNGHSQTLDEVVRNFGCVPLDGCILTKIDEAASLGAAYSAVIRHHLPIAFLANGQRVPEDLHTAAGRSVSLVNYSMRLMRESGQRVGEEFMARNFGEVRANVCA